MRSWAGALIVSLFTFYLPSHAMEDDAEPTHNLSTLARSILLAAKHTYQSTNQDDRSPDTLKKIVDATLEKTITDKGLHPAVLPVIHTVLREEYTKLPIYTISALEVYKQPVRAIDVSHDARHILVGVGNTAFVWHKEDKWRKKGHIQHAWDITAACFGRNNILVSADAQGFVFITPYEGNSLKYEYAFQCAQDFAPTMIALNDAGSRLACGDKEGELLHIYKRTLTEWNCEDAPIPIGKEIEPTALAWTADDRILAYGKFRTAQDSGMRAITRWQCVANRWYCTACHALTFENELDVLADYGYNITRRDADTAVLGSGRMKVAVTEHERTRDDNSIVHSYTVWVGQQCPITYENIIDYLAGEWNPELE